MPDSRRGCSDENARFPPWDIDMQRCVLAALLAVLASTASAADACLDRALQAHAFSDGAGQISIATLAPDGSRDTRVLGSMAAGAAMTVRRMEPSCSDPSGGERFSVEG